MLSDKTQSRIYLAAALLIVVLILILLGLAVVSRLQNPKAKGSAGSSIRSAPTVTLFPSSAPGWGSTSQGFRIVAAIPGPNDAPIATEGAVLEATLSKPVTDTGIQISFDPPALYSYSTKGNSVRVRFARPLAAGTLYAYAITNADGESAYGTFRTQGPEPSPGIMVNEPEINERIDRLQLEENPDLYLHNRLPYQTERFRIESYLVTEPETYYAFKVISRDGSNVKAEAEAWILSTGLPRGKLERLSISYE